LLSIVIPNYNGLEHLKSCYSSLRVQSFQDFNVILVDNGSTDGSVEYSKSHELPVSVIELNENTGFAHAVNMGIEIALKNEKVSYILLLNNDIELDKDFLKNGLDAFNRSENIYFAAVKMLNYFDRKKIDDCGDFIKANGGSPFARGHGETDNKQYDVPEYIFGACGGAAFYKRELFEKAGLFDEEFFAYYEDIDLSFRAQLLDLKCYYQPDAVCYHKRGGTSSVATHGFQTMMCERNLVLMRYRNYPLSLYILYQPLFFAARVKRYFSLLTNHGFDIFMSAVKGYVKGLFTLPKEYSNRKKIQLSRKISAVQVKKLFSE
jgi:GT2 family glycosyltransferase